MASGNSSLWTTAELGAQLASDRADASISDFRAKPVPAIEDEKKELDKYKRPFQATKEPLEEAKQARTLVPRIEMRERAENPEGMTAIEVLKSAWPEVNHLGGMPNLLMSWCLDKDFEGVDVDKLCGGVVWGEAVRQLFLRANNIVSGQTINQVSRGMACGRAKGLARYRGLPEEDARIRRAVSGSREHISTGNFVGNGAASVFTAAIGVGDVADVPIAVVGAGPAGIMAMRALKQFGFTQLSMFEKRKESLGIWGNENVYTRSRNNPRPVNFFGNALQQAPGNGTEVRTFLQNLQNYYGTALLKSEQEVARITPANLGTVLQIGKELKEFPIVVNCAGLGHPVPLSDPGRMTTLATRGQAGQRWQRALKSAEMAGRRYVFIGLGNSTAEMLRQAHDAQDAGYEVDYRVLTHYPREAVFEPDAEVERGGRRFRVFRDVSVPNLVDFQGDLPASRYDYFRALNAGRIIYGVKAWNVIGPAMAVSGPGRRLMSFGYDEVYTLTGYQHATSALATMGIQCDRHTGAPRYDYDGEFQRPARDPQGRTYKGYFGFGAVLDAPHNRNAIVIPGMAAQIGDLLMTLIVRAAEYKRRKR